MKRRAEALSTTHKRHKGNNCELEHDIDKYKKLLAQRDECIQQRDECIARQSECIATQSACITQQSLRIAQRDAYLAQRDACLAQRDACIALQSKCIAERDAGIAERDAYIALCQRDFEEQAYWDTEKLRTKYHFLALSLAARTNKFKRRNYPSKDFPHGAVV